MDSNERYDFKTELLKRLKEPWGSAFHGYFWGFVVLFALVSVFMPLFSEPRFNLSTILTAIATYSIAIIASSSLDLCLSISTVNKASFTIYSFIVFIISIILFCLAIFLPECWALIPAIIGFIIAILVWIIANAEKDNYNDEKYAAKLRESITKTNEYDDLFKIISKDDES